MGFKYELTDDNSKMIVDDPIYGRFEVESPFKDIILTKEMRRLEKITQNGFSSYDYPGLENNERLSHSVGAFHVMSEIVKQLEKELQRYDINISKDDKDMALCSMLLHDIGHGPFSHSFEKVTNYSHEKRTTDILLGDTEVHKLLQSIYGDKKLKRIASYIAEINEDEDKVESKNSFTKLMKSLISHQLDADRLDYLVRDAYHAKVPSAINYKNLINSLGISVNSNQEYELLVDKKGLTSIETILIERFQRYRDVYYTRSSEILENNFMNIINRCRENPDSVNQFLPDSFKKFVLAPGNLFLEDFLNMTDYSVLETLNTIKEKSSDLVLSYLCDMPRVLNDYQDLENNISSEAIKEKLKNIFPDRDLSKTLSIIEINKKTKLYKKEESLRIDLGNVHKDLSEATPHLIRPGESLEKHEISFNTELLRLELGMSKKEFDNYREEIKNMINDLNKKPEEFELKYIIDKNTNIEQDNIINTLLNNDFRVIKMKTKENDDEYYDTKDFSMLSRGGSLRIRKLTQDGKQKYKATYKMPTSVGEVYSSREEIEIDLDNNSIDELKEKMEKRNVEVNLDNVIKEPFLNSKTKRKDIVLEKNGVQVCLSFDNTNYINHIKETSDHDSMVEIEALGSVGHRVMLNEINTILEGTFPELKPNKQSKYERGMKKTMNKELSKEKDEVEK
ncbi:MAG: CYTH domain-containing protein [Clostridia bacterium]|nr:CYTH domain-containing protein [Clostridia bacterium]